MCRGFPPVVGRNPRVLILGSMPGRESLRLRQYYAHPRNAFWDVMALITGVSKTAPYALRCEGLRRVGVALWDVCRRCVRKSSLDSDIKQPESNDFVSFFKDFPSIHTVVFNGATAERLFHRLVAPVLWTTECPITLLRAPSTSPANARMSVADKISVWQKLLTNRLGDACQAP